MYLRRALTTSLRFLRLYRLLLSCLIAAAAGPAEAGSSSQPINSPREIGGRIAGRWTPPRTVEMLEVTVRLSFSRTGAVIGEPRVTYIKAPDEGGLKEKIKTSVLAAIKACTPLPFTPSLGAAIAGHMLSIRIRSLPLSGRQRLT
ncbi:MAG: hypothetical protein WBX25_33985 [Rhodomicrobium sp.]